MDPRQSCRRFPDGSKSRCVACVERSRSQQAARTSARPARSPPPRLTRSSPTTPRRTRPVAIARTSSPPRPSGSFSRSSRRPGQALWRSARHRARVLIRPGGGSSCGWHLTGSPGHQAAAIQAPSVRTTLCEVHERLDARDVGLAIAPTDRVCESDKRGHPLIGGGIGDLLQLIDGRRAARELGVETSRRHARCQRFDRLRRIARRRCRAHILAQLGELRVEGCVTSRPGRRDMLRRIEDARQKPAKLRDADRALRGWRGARRVPGDRARSARSRRRGRRRCRLVLACEEQAQREQSGSRPAG